jgi:hypothetical protein
MKGATLKAMLERLGISRPTVGPVWATTTPTSSRSFTMKSRVGYPKKPSETLEEAQTWVNRFVGWYNEEHRHTR